MKKLILRAAAVSLFFVLIGAVVDKVSARFKSDDKALDIIKRARLAIGGDAAIAQVKSLVITAKTTSTFSLDGADKTEQGEAEFALQLPDRLMKNVKIGKFDGTEQAGLVEKQFNVVLVERSSDPGNAEGSEQGKRVIIERVGPGGDTKDIVVRRGDDGTATWETESGDVKKIKMKDGKKVVIKMRDKDDVSGADGNVELHKVRRAHDGMRQNELLRLTLSLLISAPEGIDVSYTFAGEGDVNGTPVNAVLASFGGQSYKLFFDRYSNLPVAISYQGHAAPTIVRFKQADGAPNAKSGDVLFTRKEGGEPVETFVRFSDYRSTNGVQLPYKWTTTVNGKVTETLDVSSYDINPANIEDRFKNERVMVRKLAPKEN